MTFLDGAVLPASNCTGNAFIVEQSTVLTHVGPSYVHIYVSIASRLLNPTMIIYKCRFTGDEMCSDAFKPGPVLDADGKAIEGLMQIQSQKVNKVRSCMCVCVCYASRCSFGLFAYRLIYKYALLPVVHLLYTAYRNAR